MTTTIEIEHEDYKGRTRHKVSRVGAKAIPVEGDSAKQLADQLEGLIADADVPVSVAPMDDSGGLEDSDIPF